MHCRPTALVRFISCLPAIGLVVLLCSVADGQASFVNWENPHVHPLDRTPDGTRLLAVNTADNRLEIFDISTGALTHLASVPVGLDPVSVRARDNNTAWVVNHISDSVSLVDLNALNVVETLATDDEPTDVVFAGAPGRAFVSCSQANTVLVFDLSDLSTPPTRLAILGEEPRMLAVSNDGASVYAAIYESGNNTTVLGGGGATMATLAYPPNVVNHPSGPYGGENPPPNSGTAFVPALNPLNPPPPAVGLIVRKNAAGDWLDDNGGDWTPFVTGPVADESGRLPGWSLADHDVAVIDTSTLALSYITGLMNMNMAIDVNPTTGLIGVVGTEAINEVRFEPNVNGRFVRVHMALVNPATPSSPTIVDLNSHLTYTAPTAPPSVREQSIGDPRGIAWKSDGSRAYVSGMGSNNIVIVDNTGSRAGIAPTIEVGEGPTGLVLSASQDLLYVLNRFAGTISVVDVVLEQVVATASFYDPTPVAIKLGRPHLYDTHATSGLGQLSCGSCHVDARTDRLAWDLGDPSGTVKLFNQNCLMGIDPTCDDWHPMKGPMTTQTLQDIIGKEPHHWRGDRDGIEEFNGAFEGLLGDDEQLTATEMQEFENFLATIHFPPNPFRNFNNTLPTNLPLPGHFTTGRFAAAGQPLPNGNAVAGLLDYRTANLDNPLDCVTCHALPTGAGSDTQFVTLFSLGTIPVGPNGEHHLAVNGMDGSTNITMKVPHLRNVYEKVGFEATQLTNLSGFGFLHDGSVDSIARFVSEPAFDVTSDQQVANLVAFMLAFSGSELPQGSLATPAEPPGVASRDTHAAVGRQVTIDTGNRTSPTLIALLTQISGFADAGKVGLVAHGVVGGIARGYRYNSAGLWQSDRLSETITTTNLRLAAADGAEITVTVVPFGSQTRIGIDRDLDTFFDRDELDVCSDPAAPLSTPLTSSCSVTFVRGDVNIDGAINIADAVFALEVLFSGLPASSCADAMDCNDDGALNIADPIALLNYMFSGLGLTLPAPTVCGVDPSADALGCAAFGVCP
ncbi:MAG: beta-propeller fold lactonase family protein [Planctomycetota bacterium]